MIANSLEESAQQFRFNFTIEDDATLLNGRDDVLSVGKDMNILDLWEYKGSTIYVKTGGTTKIICG